MDENLHQHLSKLYAQPKAHGPKALQKLNASIIVENKKAQNN
jgi:hypothetical protein